MGRSYSCRSESLFDSESSALNAGLHDNTDVLKLQNVRARDLDEGDQERVVGSDEDGNRLKEFVV